MPDVLRSGCPTELKSERHWKGETLVTKNRV